MPKGLPLGYIKKWGISKLAWRKFRAGALTKGVPTRTASIKKRLKGKVKSMAKKKRSRRSGGMTLPIAPIVGLAAGILEPAGLAVKGDWNGMLEQLSCNYTGYSPYWKNWDAMRMSRGVLPLVAGLLVHKFVGGAPLNLNRTLARAKVPFIRI